MASLMPPIGSNFQGLNVAPGTTASLAAEGERQGQKAMALEAGISEMSEQRRKAAQFQQLLQKGVDGARQYAAEVQAKFGDIGINFEGHLQGVSQLAQMMGPEEAQKALVGFYDSVNKLVEKRLGVRPTKSLDTIRAEAKARAEGTRQGSARAPGKDPATEKRRIAVEKAMAAASQLNALGVRPTEANTPPEKMAVDKLGSPSLLETQTQWDEKVRKWREDQNKMEAEGGLPVTQWGTLSETANDLYKSKTFMLLKESKTSEGGAASTAPETQAAAPWKAAPVVIPEADLAKVDEKKRGVILRVQKALETGLDPAGNALTEVQMQQANEGLLRMLADLSLKPRPR